MCGMLVVYQPFFIGIYRSLDFRITVPLFCSVEYEHCSKCTEIIVLGGGEGTLIRSYNSYIFRFHKLQCSCYRSCPVVCYPSHSSQWLEWLSIQYTIVQLLCLTTKLSVGTIGTVCVLPLFYNAESHHNYASRRILHRDDKCL